MQRRVDPGTTLAPDRSFLLSEITLTRVGPEGIEPSTRGLKVRCSTTELQALALTGPNSLAPPRRSSVPGAGTSTPRLDDGGDPACAAGDHEGDRKSTRLNSSHVAISY